MEPGQCTGNIMQPAVMVLGVGSAKYNFWSASNGTNQSMLSADFPQSVAGRFSGNMIMLMRLTAVQLTRSLLNLQQITELLIQIL
jgi:uncharacterized protein YcsI (UPF0317 family)